MFKRANGGGHTKRLDLDDLEALLGALAPVSVVPKADITGFFHNDQLFAFIKNDQLYLRTDTFSRRDFLIYGAQDPVAAPGCPHHHEFHAVPADVINNRVRLQVWARNALRVISLELCPSQTRLA